MELEYIFMLMEQNMKVHGNQIYRMVMELKLGLMDQNMKGTIYKEKKYIYI